ncbi:hypothetical protein CEXT_617901, partial [Caerostris extrusa]
GTGDLSDGTVLPYPTPFVGQFVAFLMGRRLPNLDMGKPTDCSNCKYLCQRIRFSCSLVAHIEIKSQLRNSASQISMGPETKINPPKGWSIYTPKRSPGRCDSVLGPIRQGNPFQKPSQKQGPFHSRLHSCVITHPHTAVRVPKNGSFNRPRPISSLRRYTGAIIPRHATLKTRTHYGRTEKKTKAIEMMNLAKNFSTSNCRALRLRHGRQVSWMRPPKSEIGIESCDVMGDGFTSQTETPPT